MDTQKSEKKGWFDDIVTTPEPAPKTPEPECDHDWLPTGMDFDECSKCWAVSGPGAP